MILLRGLGIGGPLLTHGLGRGSAVAAAPAVVDGLWRKLTGEYPERRRRKRHHGMVPHPPEPAVPSKRPTLQVIISDRSPYRTALFGELTAPLQLDPEEARRREEETLAIALLLAA